MYIYTKNIFHIDKIIWLRRVADTIERNDFYPKRKEERPTLSN